MINERGILVDRKMVVGAIKISVAAQKEIDAELCVITNGAVEKVAQVERLMRWLADNGLKIADVGEESVSQALARTDLSTDVRRCWSCVATARIPPRQSSRR